MSYLFLLFGLELMKNASPYQPQQLYYWHRKPEIVMQKLTNYPGWRQNNST